MKFNDLDYWKAIILYGLNNATYKIALGKTLLDCAREGENILKWEDLSKRFLDHYKIRLDTKVKYPQQSNPKRLTIIERVIYQLKQGKIGIDEAISLVSNRGFKDVIPRFQTIGTDSNIVRNFFYSFKFGKELVIHDSLLNISYDYYKELDDELDARWSLLEGAFLINHGSWELQNDLRNIYLANGYERRSLTANVPFLQAYQGNVCFYCGEKIISTDMHIDHVLPRQVLNHDQEWNLVLAHSTCNLLKSDKVVGTHFIEKLIQRNENIIGSNHPWKHRIKVDLGMSKEERKKKLKDHYNNVIKILGPYYWNGNKKYNPETDPLFKMLITKLNSSNE